MADNRWWLVIDFGIGSDARELFEWLDSNDAKECGGSVATFLTSGNFKSIAKELAPLADEKTRLYLIGENDKGDVSGRFIQGRRRMTPPWRGYGTIADDEADQ